jgi:D-beta-D-heptose 7-phosphate kinase/D-beta-D-heptose 1-phosphate adenosyltransferase
MIFTDVNKLKDDIEDTHLIIMASGGFDPLHVGHLDYIQEAAELDSNMEQTSLVVVVNGHDWVMRKKGYEFMPEAERAAIIAGISGVDYVLIWDDGSPTVSGAIEALKPDFFAKGGDRDSKANVPEYAICESIGCEVIFNVGGGKIQSSSELVDKAAKHTK